MRVGLILLCGLIGFVNAADIVRDVSAGRVDENDNGGYLELGLVAGYYELAPKHLDDDGEDLDGGMLGVALGGAYRYNRFFIEASEGSFDGLNLGYTVFSSDRYVIDILAASIFGAVTDNDDKENPQDIAGLSEAQRDNYLLQRDTLYSGAGLRATAYIDNYVLQFRLVEDIYDEAGLTSTLRLGRSWQHRNWNFHSIVSAEYASATTNNYLYGVSPLEATTIHTEYEAGSGIDVVGEVGLTYPISKNWVWRSSLRRRLYDNAVTDSPLVEGNSNTIFYNSVSYVF